MKKIRPTCIDCNKTIADDLCLVMEADHDFDTCLCLDCRDKTERLLRKMPHIQKRTLEMLDGYVCITPTIEVDVISTMFARMLA